MLATQVAKKRQSSPDVITPPPTQPDSEINEMPMFIQYLNIPACFPMCSLAFEMRHVSFYEKNLYSPVTLQEVVVEILSE